MIQGMKFESKKYVLTWGTLFMLLLLTFAAIGLMHFNEYGYVFEKNTREIFFSKMKDQQISLADKQKLQEEVDHPVRAGHLEGPPAEPLSFGGDRSGPESRLPRRCAGSLLIKLN